MENFARWLMANRARQIVLMVAMFCVPGLAIIGAGIASAGVLAYGIAGALPLIGAGAAAVGLLFSLSAGTELGFAVAQRALLLLGVASVATLLLRRTRSLTLTVQLLTVLMLAGIALFILTTTDVVGYWSSAVAETMKLLQDAGVTAANLSDAERNELAAAIAPAATGLAGLFGWYSVVLIVLIGYWLHDVGREQGEARYGRFRDLDLGRALAAVLLASAVLGTLTSGLLLQNVALAGLFAFSLHGVALMHWLRHRRGWPTTVLVVGYALLLIPLPIAGIAILAVCVAGYVDAWFKLIRSVPAGTS